MALLSPLVGQDVYEVGEALVDLSDFSLHANHVNVVKQP